MLAQPAVGSGLQASELGHDVFRIRAEKLREKWIREVQLASVLETTPCNSSLHGDERHRSCKLFCKPMKAENHCKWCKCQACGFCGIMLGPNKSVSAALKIEPVVSFQPDTPFAASVTSVFLPHLLSIHSAGFPINLFSRQRFTQTRVSQTNKFNSLSEPLLTRVYYNGEGPLPKIPFVEWFDLDLGKATKTSALACAMLTNVDHLSAPSPPQFSRGRARSSASKGSPTRQFKKRINGDATHASLRQGI